MSCQLSVAKLNDLLRETFLTGQVVLTKGVYSLADGIREQVITKVRTYDDFSEDNDPYREHDFGSFEHDEAGTIFWKIDYYDPSMTWGSDDPSDPKKTSRVLTIMLASEY